MIYQPILLLMVFHTVCSYYLYNPYTHDILVLSSLANVPRGYKLIPPPYERRSSKPVSDDQNHIGQCSDPGFFCIKPYDSLQTYQFHCSKDSQCPHFYKCCRHRCFTHRICVKATIQREDANRTPQNSNIQRQGTCEKWPYSCRTPYHHSLTSIFKCENDKQCPRAFKCCQQSCFEHKICSRAIAHKHEYVEEIRRNETRDTKRTTGTESDENDLIQKSTTEISTTAGTDEETTEVDTTEVDTTEVDTTEVETTEVNTTGVDTTEVDTTEIDTTEVETTEAETTEDLATETETTEGETTEPEYVEELENTLPVDYTETTTEKDQETTNGVSSDSETTTEISTSEGISHSDDLDYSSETTIEMEHVRLNYTDQEKHKPRQKPSFKNRTPDPNAIIPEYSEFYQYYDYQNETDYDTDSTYS